MNDVLVAISQNWNAALLCSFFILSLPYLLLRWYTLKRMFDNDSQCVETTKDGAIVKKGYHRNIWDLSPFPAISKTLFRDDWKIAIATFLLLLFLLLYMILKEQWFAELVKVNFGLVVGALVGKKTDVKG